jgi:hypothetical protein
MKTTDLQCCILDYDTVYSRNGYQISEKTEPLSPRSSRGYNIFKKDAASSFTVEVSTPDMEAVGFSETMATTPRR